MQRDKKVLVIGGGPAGLAATYDLAKRNIPVTCFEGDKMVGGISRTVEYKNFRFDVGGHRFFTKIPSVSKLWHEILGDDFLTRPRISRIFYGRKFFYYPLRPVNALSGLGLWQSIRIVVSYLRAKLFPGKEESTFAQWVTNRFGAELYSIFFKTYTEKVWGIPCTEIQAEWAAQRIKGLSLWTLISNTLFKSTNVVKTLINEFQYPRLGPGQMYETMAAKAQEIGACIKLRHRVLTIQHEANHIQSLQVANEQGVTNNVAGTDFISTMPITELILHLHPKPPEEVINAAQSLRYRSLLTVNLLLNRKEKLPDTWIYIHDPQIKMGRIQFFANWSPFMVPDENHSSVGLEYFCSEGDSLWSASEKDLLDLGKKEVEALGLVKQEEIIDGFIIKMAKCYPVYDRTFQKNLSIIQNYLIQFDNLQLCGRYGLFKYNNMDHSILTALYAVENILGAQHNVWTVNADDEYHEEKIS